MKFGSLLVLISVLSLAACSPSPKKAIVGSWSGSNANGEQAKFKFFADGTGLIKGPEGSVEIKWSIPYDGVLELLHSRDGTSGQTFKSKFQFMDKDTLKCEMNGITDILTRDKD